MKQYLAYQFLDIGDFRVETTEVVINAGNTSGCFDFEIIEDNIFEEDEEITLTLVSSDPQIIINQNTTVIEIIDNDGVYLASSCHIFIWEFIF